VHLSERVTVSFVQKAYRLLRKSVVHVQHADVQFDEDAELDDLANQALEGAGEDEDDDELAAAAAAAAAASTRRVTTLTFREFEQIKAVLVARLRRAENEAVGAGAPPAVGALPAGADGDGDADEVVAAAAAPAQAAAGALRRRELVEYYLEQLQIDSELELGQQRRTVDLVITRLIKRERAIIELPAADGGVQADKGERLLVLHAGAEA
jgi:predicted regulator of Ras-like GTPase activity (Roadblock/LC7/MglB family)